MLCFVQKSFETKFGNFASCRILETLALLSPNFTRFKRSKMNAKLYQFLLDDKAKEKTAYKLKDRLIKKTLDARHKERYDNVIAIHINNRK